MTYSAIEGTVHEARALLDVAESEWHARPDSPRCLAALKAAARLVDELHKTCCGFVYREELNN